MSLLPLLLTALCSVSTGGHFLSLGVIPKEDEEGKKPIPKPSEFAVSLQWPSGVWGKRQSHTPHPRELHTNSSSPRQRQTSSTQHQAGNEGGIHSLVHLQIPKLLKAHPFALAANDTELREAAGQQQQPRKREEGWAGLFLGQHNAVMEFSCQRGDRHL